MYRRQESRPSPRKINAKRQKWLSEEALQIAEKRSEKQRIKGKIDPTECRVPENSKERLKKKKKSQQKGENNRMLKTRDHFRRRHWQPTPVLLPGKSHGRRSLVGCSPRGRTESDTTEAT